MGKNRKDAVGGHYDRDKEYAGGFCGWTPKFKRWAKERSNRVLRRQHRRIEAEALLEYEDELEEFRNFERELDEYDEFNACYYDDYYDDLERAERDRELEDQYEREMEYEAEREFQAFIYDRDSQAFDPDWY